MPQVTETDLNALATEVGPMMIAQQNDQFRKTLNDAVAQLNAALFGAAVRGQTLITQGVNAHGYDFVTAAMTAVAEFDTFDEENDPKGEHDFGSVEIEGQTVFWKIDLYDNGYLHGTPNPHDLKATRRVLTIMLASEY